MSSDILGETDILVNAQRRDELKNFVASMTPINRSKQLGRWNGQVCPVVAGLPQRQAMKMIARIGEVASSVNLKLAGKSCSKPLIILIDNEASATAADLSKRFPITLRHDGVAMLGNFVRSSEPVRWLSLTNNNGFNASGSTGQDLQEGVNSTAARRGGWPSRLEAPLRPEISAMIVIVDGKQLADVSLEALSDYVSFVAFANPRQGADWPSRSVMSLFDNDRDITITNALSADDASYLKALYATSVESQGQNQRNSIVSNMMRSDRIDRQP